MRKIGKDDSAIVQAIQYLLLAMERVTPHSNYQQNSHCLLLAYSLIPEDFKH